MIFFRFKYNIIISTEQLKSQTTVFSPSKQMKKQLHVLRKTQQKHTIQRILHMEFLSDFNMTGDNLLD